jgi:hypothetical protein
MCISTMAFAGAIQQLGLYNIKLLHQSHSIQQKHTKRESHIHFLKEAMELHQLYCSLSYEKPSKLFCKLSSDNAMKNVTTTTVFTWTLVVWSMGDCFILFLSRHKPTWCVLYVSFCHGETTYQPIGFNLVRLMGIIALIQRRSSCSPYSPGGR